MSKWLVAEWTVMIFLHLMNCFDVNIERLFVFKCGMTLWASMTVRLFKLHGWEISFWIKCSQRGCSTFHERLFFRQQFNFGEKKIAVSTLFEHRSAVQCFFIVPVGFHYLWKSNKRQHGSCSDALMWDFVQHRQLEQVVTHHLHFHRKLARITVITSSDN